MQIFGVAVNTDDTVRVIARDVVKETPQFYFVARLAADLPWREYQDIRAAFGYSERIAKDASHVSARSALAHYMARRQRDKANAQAVISQATKQIASANELLMHLPGEPPGRRGRSQRN
jgi:hypothetical protein